MTESERECLAKPEGLSPAGERAYKAVMEFLEKEEATHPGGCKTFYSPAAWRERGEEYGLRSALIIVHDGGSVAPYCNLSYEAYKEVDRFAKHLHAAGFFVEACTSWYSAVYRREGPEPELPPEAPLTPAEKAKVPGYRAADLERFAPAIAEAKALWAKRCAEFKGNPGSCVIGAGIVVEYLAPRCRRTKRRMIISSSEATGRQGSCVWEESVHEVIAFLKSKGIEAEYECGCMD